ncbi:MAG: hypothetical protein BMS9Abin11_0226 [Gammaproteobacteria bacterium]|nr:MAG: hypothetical protein BMS9Abin11_0226 [Gammaproteobacteria bacterium]
MDILSSLSEEVTTDLTKHGADLSKQHDFDFYLYFGERGIAKKAASELEKAKFLLEIKPASDSNGWLCLAKRSVVPNPENLNLVGNILVAVAENLGGEFDGWESNIIR